MKKVVSLLFVVVLLAACAPAQQPQELPVIRYANFQVFDAVYIAQDLGYFTDNGIKVDIVGTNFGGPTAIQAVSSGKAEAGLSSYMAIINAVSAGLPVAAAADIQSELQDSPKEVFLVRADSGITNITQLEGSTIAINLVKSSFHYTWLMALDNAGMKADAVTFVNLPFSAQPEALHKGDVFAIGLIEPFAALAEKQYPGEFVRLFTGADVFGYKQFSVVFVNSIWARENPEQADAFISAVKRAEVWANGNQQQAKEIVAKYLSIASHSDIPDYKFNADGRVDMESVAFWVGFMKSNQYITADWLTEKDIVYAP